MWPLLRSSACVSATVWAGKVGVSDLELVEEVARVNVRPIIKSQGNIARLDTVIDAGSSVQDAPKFGTSDPRGVCAAGLLVLEALSVESPQGDGEPTYTVASCGVVYLAIRGSAIRFARSTPSVTCVSLP